MELREFVTWVLTEIDKWLTDASSHFEDYNYVYWRNLAWKNSIDFNVKVYSWDWTKNDWWLGIQVAWLLKLWSSGSSESSNYNISEISFSVVRKNTREKDKKEKELDKISSPDKKIVRVDMEKFR